MLRHHTDEGVKAVYRIDATATDATPEAAPFLNAKASARAGRAARARNASGRRRFVDPTTCDREYSVAETEFMRAMHAYRQRSGGMFPTWGEVLEVVRGLGYEKAPAGA
jgi:hypothetical protein